MDEKRPPTHLFRRVTVSPVILLQRRAVCAPVYVAEMQSKHAMAAFVLAADSASHEIPDHYFVQVGQWDAKMPIRTVVAVVALPLALYRELKMRWVVVQKQTIDQMLREMDAMWTAMMACAPVPQDGQYPYVPDHQHGYLVLHGMARTWRCVLSVHWRNWQDRKSV